MRAKTKLYSRQTKDTVNYCVLSNKLLELICGELIQLGEKTHHTNVRLIQLGEKTHHTNVRLIQLGEKKHHTNVRLIQLGGKKAPYKCTADGQFRLANRK